MDTAQTARAATWISAASLCSSLPIILGLTEFEQYVDDHTDTVIFGFNKLVKLLLEKKKRTTEGEFNPHIPEVQGFIREELPKQKAICDAMPDDRNKDWSPLNRCFAEIIGVEAGKPE